MPFTKGKSGNAIGRPRGRHTDPASRLNTRINNFLDKNFDVVMNQLSTPAGREKARIYCELLKYSVPRLSPKRTDIRFERLSDEQLDEIIQTLQHNALKELKKKAS